MSLTPLRIPAGWSIAWNTLYESSRAEDGDFGGSSLFHAVHTARRFAIDVAFLPEHDPAGHFELTVIYQPWLRSPKGRRLEAPLVFDGDAEGVHRFETRSFEALVRELEAWLGRCAGWQREGN